MGLFTTSTSTSPASPPCHANPPPSADGAYIAPDRTKRDRCWHARDAFFDCLERNGIVDSLKEKERSDEVCGWESRGLERECAASWVTYFKQRRVMEHNKKTTLERLKNEGAEKIQGGLPPNLPKNEKPGPG